MKYILILIIALVYGCSTSQSVMQLSGAVSKTHFAHDYWEVSLPGKWRYHDEDGAFVASSEGDQYALYITVFNVPDNTNVENWAAEEIKTLKSIKYQISGYTFEFPTVRNFKVGNQVQYVVDGIELKNKMRMYSKGVLSNGMMYTISFHDYDYDYDYDYSNQKESDKVLQLILNHLDIKT